MTKSFSLHGNIVLSLILIALGACSHAPPPAPPLPPPPPPPAPPPPPPAKLVVFPLDTFALPDAAESLNAKLTEMKLAKTTPAVPSTLSMEAAQLQTDCAQPTMECYGKIAKQVEADRIAWAEVEKVGKKKKKGPVKVRLILFDAQKAAIIATVEEIFLAKPTPEALDTLIGKIVTVGDASTLADTPSSSSLSGKEPQAPTGTVEPPAPGAPPPPPRPISPAPAKGPPRVP